MLVGQTLAGYLRWSEAEFLQRTEGSPIRRIGHERWLRNAAVAAGNALVALPLGDPDGLLLREALGALTEHPSALVREHVAWATAQGAAGEGR